MAVVGIIAEFNPLHKGHEYLIKEAKSQGTVVCVISGNFVQRGEAAVCDKRLRAKAALMCGADLVLELPTPWAMSTAENFALGGVSILNSIGCDKIIFGSECGEAEPLKKAAELLLSDEFSEILQEKLKTGVNFAVAREEAAKEFGFEGDVLSKPNNNLAVEYIKAIRLLNSKMEPVTLKRKGADHDSLIEAEFVSATLLREKLREGDFSFCSKYMSDGVLSILTPQSIGSMQRIDRSILAVLRTKSLEELKKLPDISEGVENKLFSEIRLAENTQSLYNSVKVKRYTHARIRRLVLSAFLGLDNSFFKQAPPYIRVLGFSSLGAEVLKTAATSSGIPVVTKFSQIKALGGDALRLFEIESRATDLFGLTLNKPLPCGMEYTSKIIKTE